MKILFVSCAYPPHNGGGVAKLLTNLSAELMKKGHQVYVFGLMDDISHKKYAIENTIINGVVAKFINVPMSSSTDFFGRYRTIDYYNPDINLILKSHLSEIKPDVVHFHAIQGLGANLITETHKEGYPTILTMHDMWWFCPNLFMTDLKLNPCNQTKVNLNCCKYCLQELHRYPIMQNFNLESFIAERAAYLKNVLENDVDIILTVSRTLKEYVTPNVDCKVQVNENGVTKISDQSEKPVNPHKIIFGFVGGNLELKGYNILMDAFRSMELSNWELHIYGVEKTSDMNLRNVFMLNVKNKTLVSNIIRFFRSKTKEAVIDTNIKHFPKYSDLEKHSILNTFDIIIIPSIIKESFSLIAREGLMLKKPIICSNCGGPEEVIEDNVNGLIFKNKNVDDLKSKIHAILKKPSLISKLTNNIDIHKIQLIEEQVNELENIYRGF